MLKEKNHGNVCATSADQLGCQMRDWLLFDVCQDWSLMASSDRSHQKINAKISTIFYLKITNVNINHFFLSHVHHPLFTLTDYMSVICTQYVVTLLSLISLGDCSIFEVISLLQTFGLDVKLSLSCQIFVIKLSRESSCSSTYISGHVLQWCQT